MSMTRAQRLEAFERWAGRVKPEELEDADSEIVREIVSAAADRHEAVERAAAT
jgi:class 3 adenylate cyclase